MYTAWDVGYLEVQGRQKQAFYGIYYMLCIMWKRGVWCSIWYMVYTLGGPGLLKPGHNCSYQPVASP